MSSKAVKITDLSIESLKQILKMDDTLNRQIRERIISEISYREQHIRFCPADHTIFVYNDLKKVKNIEKTITVSLRTSSLETYNLKVDVLNLQGHYFYATYYENLPKDKCLLARLIPVEILTNPNDSIWMCKIIDYKIFYSSQTQRRQLLKNLISYGVYSHQEMEYLLSQIANIFPYDLIYQKELLNIEPAEIQYVNGLKKQKERRERRQQRKMMTQAVSKPADSKKQTERCQESPRQDPHSQQPVDQAKAFQDLKSWLLRLKTNLSPNEIIIVEDIHEQNTAENIYWEGRNISQGILAAIANNDTKFSYNQRFQDGYIVEFCGTLHDIKTSELFMEKYQPALQYFINTNDLPVVYVFSNKTIADFEDYSMVTVYVRNYWTHKLNPFNVYYLEKKDMYFINKSSYDVYREKYGLPFLRLIPGEYSERNYELRVESQLHIYGYSLEYGNTKARRQEVLAFLIDSGIMTKVQIQNHIEWLIHTHRDSLNYTNACDKWEEDLLFVNEYNINAQRKILAKDFITK